MPAAAEIVLDTAKNIDQQTGKGPLRKYSDRLKHVESVGHKAIFNRQAFPFKLGGDGVEQLPAPSEDVVRAELERDLGLKLGGQEGVGSPKTAQPSQQGDVNGDRVMDFKASVPPRAASLNEQSPIAVPASVENSDTEEEDEEALLEDSDAEEEVLPCGQCGLPIGDISYDTGDVRMDLRCRPMHGECMAQRMLVDMRNDDHERRQKEAALKNSRRKEFSIGWKVDSVPPNASPAQKMGSEFVPQGMCCLVLQEESRTVSVVPTLEPAGAVNLAYLSTALKVRRQEGREPLFSLDPVDPDKDDSKQVKRFEPEWLVGTCVGEVLFQADYYLKELSFGEYAQPVVGMRSCFDYTWDEGDDKGWRAREWFMVRKAEVHISEDNVVIPFVRMGVEAWEQVVAPNGELKDAKLTRRDHPLLRYAQEFTHNFDLIAERKSVVYHLRDLAKASVLAKYLVDSQMHVPEAWFSAGGVTAETISSNENLEIPQLWNERFFSKIRLEDGTIVDYASTGTKSRGIYGGVSFGLDRFNVASHGRAARAMLQGVSPGLISQARPRPGLMPQRRAAITGADPRGVDLNLDSFDLSKAKRVASHATALQVGQDACAALGEDFWLNLDSHDESVFKEDDRLLLARLLNPLMSDRRDEGAKFIPPDTNNTYLERLSNLMKEEDRVRSQRKEHFCSKQFQSADPGPLFPSCWKDYIEIDRKASGSPAEGVLHERPDYTAKAEMFDNMLHSAIPVFDKSTEEGLRFRVYRIGVLEVRTILEVGRKEMVGAVFSRNRSTRYLAQGEPVEKTKGVDRISKLTIYVETSRSLSSAFHYYAVVATAEGNLLAAEMHSDGRVTWEENPVDLDVRNSLAKTFRSADCSETGVTVQEIKNYSVGLTDSEEAGLALSTGKRYAQGVYDWARGETQRAARFRTILDSKVPPASTGAAAARTRRGWEGLALQARNHRKECGYHLESA